MTINVENLHIETEEALKPMRKPPASATAVEDTHRVIEEPQIIRPPVEDQQQFAEMLINPPPVPAAMRRAHEAHQRLISKPA